MGDPTPPPGELGRLIREIKALAERVRDLERPTGTQRNRVVEELAVLVSNIQAQLEEWTSTRYTNTQLDTKFNAKADTTTVTAGLAGKVAKTGDTMSGDLSTSARLISSSPVRSPGARSYVVATGYAGLWIESDGTMGISPSTRVLKKNLTPMAEESPAGIDAVRALLELTPYWGHYVWDDSGEPLKSFLIAEDVHEAGFGPDVAPTGEDGEPFTLNYSQLVPAIVAALQSVTARLDAAGL
jgi:hypothetical protein